MTPGNGTWADFRSKVKEVTKTNALEQWRYLKGHARGAALGFAVLLTACALIAATPSESQAGGTVIVATHKEPDTLLWRFGNEAFGYWMALPTNGPMLRFTPNREFQPHLLTEVPGVQNGGISKDGKTITLRFRRDAHWQDKTPVTVRDFVFTWKTVMEPKGGILVRLGWDQILKVDTPDQYTAVVHLKVSYAPFVGIVLAGRFGHLLPEHAYRDIPDLARSKYARKPLGNGPFEVVEWVSGDHITLKRNENYWGPKAKLDRIIFRFVPDRNALVTGIKAGEFDIAFELDPVELSKVENDLHLQNLVTPGTINERFLFNLLDPNDISKPHPVFGDRRVRLAVAHAIDRKGIVEGLVSAKASVAVNDLDSTAYAHPNLKPYPFDPNRARQLLDEAGWKPGPDGVRVKDGKRLAITYMTVAGNVLRERIQVVVQRFLQDVGFEVKIRNYRSAQIHAGCATGGIAVTHQFDFFHGSTGVAGTDPDLSNHFMKSEIPDCKTTPFGRNTTGFWTPELEELLKAQLATMDVARRKKLMYRIQEILYENAPGVWLYNRPDIVVLKKRVRGLDPTLSMSGGISWNSEAWSVD